jgi:nicotinamidase-related amidase
MKTDLLIIDPQNDFCDPNGNLFVPGADKDIERLSDFISKNRAKINDIHVTMDMHHTIDVAHPIFLKDSNGNHPKPFTIIDIDDVKTGKITTTNPSFLLRFTKYLQALLDNGRYPHCIWPPHCLIGSEGSNIQKNLFEVLLEWEKEEFGIVNYVTKGSNFWVEHFSAVQAEVPDPEDPSTQLNIQLIETLQKVDRILISGQALSHCVANTIRDIADNFGEENIKKFVLLEDTSSSVPGFESLGDHFINEMTGRGMQVSNTKDFVW